MAGTRTAVALVGPPNSGKTTLFNRLTGLRQKVANFPGVTVEQHSGIAELADGRERGKPGPDRQSGFIRIAPVRTPERNDLCPTRRTG